MRAVSSTDVPGAFIHLTISALQPFPDRTSNRPRSASLCQGLQYIALYNYISKSCTTHLRKHITLKIVTPEALEGDLKVLRPLRTIKTSYAGSLLIRQMLDDFRVGRCISMCRVPSPHHLYQGIQEDTS